VADHIHIGIEHGILNIRLFGDLPSSLHIKKSRLGTSNEIAGKIIHIMACTLGRTWIYGLLRLCYLPQDPSLLSR